MSESNRYKSTCSSDRGNIYTFVLLNGQTLGTARLARLSPAEIRPPWGTLGIDAGREAACQGHSPSPRQRFPRRPQGQREQGQASPWPSFLPSLLSQAASPSFRRLLLLLGRETSLW